MMEWFSELTSFQKMYWVVTSVSTLIFLFVLIGAFVGADGDDIGDVDAEIDADTGAGFQFFTFKNMVAFFTILDGVELLVSMPKTQKQQLYLFL